jgi:hypothetical protein
MSTCSLFAAAFLWLIAAWVATVGGLFTAMARGFHWL